MKGHCAKKRIRKVKKIHPTTQNVLAVRAQRQEVGREELKKNFCGWSNWCANVKGSAVPFISAFVLHPLTHFFLFTRNVGPSAVLEQAKGGRGLTFDESRSGLCFPADSFPKGITSSRSSRSIWGRRSRAGGWGGGVGPLTRTLRILCSTGRPVDPSGRP
jgi:hypothetical protein